MEGYDDLVRVSVESPFAAPTPEGIEEHIAYARAACMDCLKRREAPYASHLFFTQKDLLDDTIPDERMLGIMAGKKWEECAARSAFYIDKGMSTGMTLGKELCNKIDRPIVYRTLGPKWRNESGQKLFDELLSQGILVESAA